VPFPRKATDLTIVSGGQTGADRAALDFAIACGLDHGGWCPGGRMAEDGPIAAKYKLRQTPRSNYAQRTKWNVRDTDGTVVFSEAREASGGTRLTIQLARRLDKPLLHLTRQAELSEADRVAACAAALRGFLAVYSIAKLNVAGPRATQAPEIGGFVLAVLDAALSPNYQIRDSRQATAI
jgi:hypothetical protein